MQVAFVSDMHGNLPAFQAVLDRLSTLEELDYIVGGGDYAFGGLYPGECVSRVREFGWPCVRGNTDEWIVEIATDGRVPARDYPPEMARGEELQKRDRWAADRISAPDIEFMAALPLDWRVTGPSGQTLVFVHATPWSTHPFVGHDADDSELAEMLKQSGGDHLLYGHIHHQYQRRIDGGIVGCIGAVGMPFDGDPRPGFAVATDDGDRWSVEHVRVEYDRDAYIHEVEQSDMPSADAVAKVLRAASNVA
ncbi:MAG: metallophosphoesterase family protein [Chloroflexota bacterium]